MRAALDLLYLLLGVAAGGVCLSVVMRLAWIINGDDGVGIIVVCYVLGAILFSAKDPR